MIAQLVDYPTEKPGTMLTLVRVPGEAADSLTVSLQVSVVQSHASTSRHTLKMPATGRHTLSGHTKVLHTLTGMGTSEALAAAVLFAGKGT